MAASLVAAAALSGVASAHDYLGTLGNAATATDRWYFVCATGTAKVTYQIQRTAGTRNVQISFDSTGVVSGPTGTAFSAEKTATTGSGAKLFTIKKGPAAAGNVSYRVRAHCKDANNIHDPSDQTTTQTYIQNQ